MSKRRSFSKYGSLRIWRIDVTLTPFQIDKNSKKSKEGFRLYVSTTYADKDKYDGMFSFFPCKTYEKNTKGFSRPRIRNTNTLIRKIKPNQKRGFKYKPSYNDIGEVKKLWEEVKEQVSKNLKLGIRAEMPIKI